MCDKHRAAITATAELRKARQHTVEAIMHLKSIENRSEALYQACSLASTTQIDNILKALAIEMASWTHCDDPDCGWRSGEGR